MKLFIKQNKVRKKKKKNLTVKTKKHKIKSESLKEILYFKTKKLQNVLKRDIIIMHVNCG